VGSSTAALRDERLAGRAVLVPTSPGAPPGAPPIPPPPPKAPSKGDILRGTVADIGPATVGLPVRAVDARGAGCARQRPKLRASAHLRCVLSNLMHRALTLAALQRAPPPPRPPDVMGPLGGVVGPLVRAWVKNLGADAV
jgi:hypothetical protein